MLSRLFKKRTSKEEIVYAPLSGQVRSLEEVPDPTFAEKMLGDGIAIEPTEGKVVAPFSGEVIQIFPTNHAIGLRSQSGQEWLIHIGLETVAMNGEGFTAMAQAGDMVQRGDPLISFDVDLVRKKAASLMTPIVLTTDNGKKVIFDVTKDEEVTAGKSELLTIRKV